MTPQPVLDEIKNRITLSDLIGRRVNLKRVGREFVGLSPFNEEKTPSFTVNDEKQFYHCFSSGKNGDAFSFLMETEGLSFTEAVDRLSSETGIVTTVQAKPRGEKTGTKKLVAEYIYRDRDGQPYHKVDRYEYEGGGKTFTQSYWEETDHIWIGKAGPKPPIPYNLPAIIANPHEPIWLVEGEKNADDLIALGLIATTAKGGSTAFPTTADFAVWFDGATVYALPDNDEPGAKWLERVLKAVPHAIIVTIPGLPHKGDVSDWLDAGGTVEQLRAMAEYRHESEPSQPVSRIAPTPAVWMEPQDIPQREVLYGAHLYRKFVSMTVSPGGLGKSSMVMVEALAMTSNKPLLGEPIYDGPLNVWHWNGEDPQDENNRRMVAAAVHHGLKPDDFIGRLWLDSGRSMAIRLAQMTRGDIAMDEELFVEIENALIERGIDVLQLDPFVSVHSVPENDNGAIDDVVKRLGKVADRCNCAIELVHHVRKASAGSTSKTDANDARGAGALVAGVRSVRSLNVMTEDDANKIGLPVDDRFSYFTVDMVKANLAKRDGKSSWRHLASVNLGNDTPIRPGDNVGVVEKYDPPASAQMDMWPENAAEIAQRVAEESDTWRHWPGSGPIPADWFGFAIARRCGLDETEDRKAVRIMIGKWIKAGVLTLRSGTSEGKNKVLYVASTRAIEDEMVTTSHYDDTDVPF